MPNVESPAKKLLPPYVPYKTYEAFLESLRVALPGEIDRSVMPTFSGAIQGWLLSSLRYLDLIDEDGIPTVLLHDLLNAAKGEQEKSAHRMIIKNGYKFLFENFNLLTATPRMLDQKFTDTGAQGETARKCVAFFLSYAKANNLPMSPHLKAPRTRASGPRARKKTTANGLEQTERESRQSAETGLNWQQLMLTKFPAFDPNWDDDVKAKWFDGFQRLMKIGESGALD